MALVGTGILTARAVLGELGSVASLDRESLSLPRRALACSIDAGVGGSQKLGAFQPELESDRRKASSATSAGALLVTSPWFSARDREKARRPARTLRSTCTLRRGLPRIVPGRAGLEAGVASSLADLTGEHGLHDREEQQLEQPPRTDSELALACVLRVTLRLLPLDSSTRSRRLGMSPAGSPSPARSTLSCARHNRSKKSARVAQAGRRALCASRRARNPFLQSRRRLALRPAHRAHRACPLPLAPLRGHGSIAARRAAWPWSAAKEAAASPRRRPRGPSTCPLRRAGPEGRPHPVRTRPLCLRFPAAGRILARSLRAACGFSRRRPRFGASRKRGSLSFDVAPRRYWIAARLIAEHGLHPTPVLIESARSAFEAAAPRLPQAAPARRELRRVLAAPRPGAALAFHREVGVLDHLVPGTQAVHLARLDQLGAYRPCAAPPGSAGRRRRVRWSASGSLMPSRDGSNACRPPPLDRTVAPERDAALQKLLVRLDEASLRSALRLAPARDRRGPTSTEAREGRSPTGRHRGANRRDPRGPAAFGRSPCARPRREGSHGAPRRRPRPTRRSGARPSGALARRESLGERTGGPRARARRLGEGQLQSPGRSRMEVHAPPPAAGLGASIPSGSSVRPDRLGSAGSRCTASRIFSWILCRRSSRPCRRLVRARSEIEGRLARADAVSVEERTDDSISLRDNSCARASTHRRSRCTRMTKTGSAPATVTTIPASTSSRRSSRCAGRRRMVRSYRPRARGEGASSTTSRTATAISG